MNIRQIACCMLTLCGIMCCTDAQAQTERERISTLSIPSVESEEVFYDELLRPLVDVPEASKFNFNDCRKIFEKYSTESEKKADSLYFRAQPLERSNMEEALSLYKQAAQMGHAQAAYRIAQIQNNGQDKCVSAEYFYKAAELGLPGAWYILATFKGRDPMDKSNPQTNNQTIRNLVVWAANVNYVPAVDILTQEAIDEYRAINKHRANLRVHTNLNNARDKAHSMVKRATALGSSKAKNFQQQLSQLP